MLKKESNKQYHSNKEYLSSSFIAKFELSALHAIQDVETTEAMRIGSIYHSLIEGVNDFIVLDINDRPEPLKAMNSKANQKWKKEITNGDITWCTSDQFYEISKMVEALKQNHHAKKLLETSKEKFKEISIYSEIDGEKVKVRPDHLVETKDYMICVDWKSIAELTEKKVTYAIRDRYRTQCGMYSMVIEQEFNKPCMFMFIFQEKKAPYDVLPVMISEETNEEYRADFMVNFRKAVKAKKENKYEGIASNYDKKYLEL